MATTFDAYGGNIDEACDLIDWEKEYDSIAVDSFAAGCLNGGDVCENFRFYTEQEGAVYELGSIHVMNQVCADGDPVCYLETRTMMLTTDGMSGGFCSLETSVGGYFCAPGYYGTANSASDYDCKPCPLNASCSSGGTQFICNSGYSANGDECCTDWTVGTRTTGGVAYKYRTCSNASETYHLYKCNEDKKYYGTIGEIVCTWNSSTNAPTNGSCSGCSLCNEYDRYEDLDTPGYARVIHTTFSTTNNETYGTVGRCLSNETFIQIGQEEFICAPNYYGVAQSNQSSLEVATSWWGCTKCPSITTSGTTNPATGITSSYPYVLVDTSANNAAVNLGGTAGNYSNSRTINDCYASSGYADLGDDVITKFQDEYGIFYWTEDGMNYSCYWAN